MSSSDNANLSNLQKLSASGLPQNWVTERPEGWDNAEFNKFLGLIEAKGMWPIDPSSVHQLLVDTLERHTPAANRIVPRQAPTAGSTQTATRLGTADWADPVDFADRHLYQKGDLWLSRDTVDGRALGLRDERHTMILGSTRGYKGTTCIVPAHITWPGSLFSLDPKGENATISAARRGQGNDVCLGMGQSVNVIDPFGEAHIEDRYRKRFNPLDALRPDDPELIEKAASVADAMVVRSETENEPFWNNKARTLIKGLILHIVTSNLFEGRRSLITLRELAVLGDTHTLDQLKQAGLEDETKGADGKPIDPFTFLFKTMQRNRSLGSVIAGIGTEFYNLLNKGVDRQWSGFHSALTDQTEFLDSPLLQKAIGDSDFDLADIKDDPKGMSLYLCLPTKHMATYHRWLRVMTNLVIYECRRTMSRPATGHRVLMCLDEFRTLEHMPEIERDISNLAGYGVKLMMVLQDLSQLQRVYEKGWETIWGSCGLVHAFAINDEFTLKKLSEHIGETDLILDAISQSEGVNSQQNENVSQNTSTSESGTESQSTSESRSQSKAFGRNKSMSHGVTNSETTGWNQSNNLGGSSNFSYGTTKGRNSGYDSPRLIGRNLHRALPFLRSNETAGMNHGSSTSHGGGESWGYTAGMSHSKTDGTSDNISEGSSETSTEGFTGGTSESVSRSSSDTRAVGRSVGASQGQNHSVSIAQSHHKRPLIYPHDIKYYFASLKESDRCFPGLGLVLIPSERPMVVQRVNYFEDVQFDALWDFNPSYPETVPEGLIRELHLRFDLDEQGGLWETNSPTIGEWYKAPGDPVNRGEFICALIPGPARVDRLNGVIGVASPVRGTVTSIRMPEHSLFESGKALCTIRYHIADALRDKKKKPIRDHVSEYNNRQHAFYLRYLDRLEQERQREERIWQEQVEHERQEAERQRLEKEQEAEAARQQAAAKRREEEEARERKEKKQALHEQFVGEYDWAQLLLNIVLFAVCAVFIFRSTMLPWPSGVVGWIKSFGLLFLFVWLSVPVVGILGELVRAILHRSREAAWNNKLTDEFGWDTAKQDQRRKRLFHSGLRERVALYTLYLTGPFVALWTIIRAAIVDGYHPIHLFIDVVMFGGTVVATVLVGVYVLLGYSLIVYWRIMEGELITWDRKIKHRGYKPS